MRELPEPDVKDAMWSMTPLHYSLELVLAIQRQAYEYGLRDAGKDAKPKRGLFSGLTDYDQYESGDDWR